MSEHKSVGWIFDGSTLVFDARSKSSVCSVDYCCPEEDQANGRLIAAAPDLLEALQMLLESNTQHSSIRVGDAIDCARKAIAKALA